MNQAQVDKKLWALGYILRTAMENLAPQPGNSEEKLNRLIRAYAGVADVLIPPIDHLLLDASHLLTREQREFLVRGKGVLCMAVERAKGLGA